MAAITGLFQLIHRLERAAESIPGDQAQPHLVQLWNLRPEKGRLSRSHMSDGRVETGPLGGCGIYSWGGAGGRGRGSAQGRRQECDRKGAALGLESDTVGGLGLITSLSQEKTFPKLLHVQTSP